MEAKASSIRVPFREAPRRLLSAYATAIKEKDVKNTIHFHMVSKDGKSAGHIDDITLAGGMTLRLPRN